VDAAASGAWWCWQGGPEVRERTQRVDDWRGCVRQSRVVLAPVAGVKPAEERRPNRVSAILQSAGDGGKRNSSPGRARYKPSNHCAGNAGVLQLYLYARVRTLRTYCTRDRGSSKHPAFPAPSCSGRMILQSSGALRREIAGAYLSTSSRPSEAVAMGPCVRRDDAQNNSQQIVPASEWQLRLRLSALILDNALLNRRP